MTTTKKLWIGIGILALLTPLGIIIPALFGAGGAWGEWSIEEIRKLTGFAPHGMERLSKLWRPPLPNYAVPGQGRGLVGGSIGYLATAVVGAALAAAVGYLVARIAGRRDRKD